MPHLILERLRLTAEVIPSIITPPVATIMPAIALPITPRNPSLRRSSSNRKRRIEGWQLANVSSVADPVTWEKNVGPDGNTNPQRAPQGLPQVWKLWRGAGELGVITRVIDRAKRANRMEASRQWGIAIWEKTNGVSYANGYPRKC